MYITQTLTMVAVVPLHVKANNAKYLHKVLMTTQIINFVSTIQL